MKYGIRLWALNSEFQIYSILDPLNIQWTRKYYEPGIFSIQIQADQYSDQIKYIYTPDRPEIGMVTQKNYSKQNGFNSIHLSGFFLENELNDKIATEQFVGKGDVVTEIARYITKFKKDIPLLEIEPTVPAGEQTDFESFGDEIGAKASGILRLHEMAYRIKYDYASNKKKFEIYKGTDRTQSQLLNNFVTFSTAFGNLENPNVLADLTDVKNYCMVKGEINNTPIYEFADLSNNGYKKEIYLENSGIQYDSAKMTEAEYKGLLKQKGVQELIEKHSVINNVDFDTNQSGYEYMSDVDLGDKCDIIISEMNLTLEARIIAIYEVIKSGENHITFEFGNQKVKERR